LFREGKFIYVVKKMFVFQSLNFRKNFLWILWQEEFLTSLVKLWQEWRWAAAQIVGLFSLSIPAAVAVRNRSTSSSVCVWCRRGAATVVKVFESFYFYAPIFQVREKLIGRSWERESLWNCSPVIPILAVNAKRNTCKATCSSYYRQSLPQHWSACFPVCCQILFSREASCCRCKHQLWNRILFHLFSVFWSSQLRGLLQSLPTPYVVIASALK
jgi:hypothetical protein